MNPHRLALHLAQRHQSLTMLRFTAPKDGIYTFHGVWQSPQRSGAGVVGIALPGSDEIRRLVRRPGNRSQRWFQCLVLTAGQAVDFFLDGGAEQRNDDWCIFVREGFARCPVLTEIANNPAPPWSYGWRATNGEFQLLDDSANLPIFCSWRSAGQPNRVELSAYPAGGDVRLDQQGATFAPNQWQFSPETLLLTAGDNEQPSTVVRFTAPAVGRYLFDAEWQSVSGSAMHVTCNTPHGTHDHYFAASGGRQPLKWQQVVQLDASQHVDFALRGESGGPAQAALRVFASLDGTARPSLDQTIDDNVFVDYIFDGKQQIDDLLIRTGDHVNGAMFVVANDAMADLSDGQDPFACQFIVTKADGRHAVFGWEHPHDPILRGRLLATDTTIASVAPGSTPVRESDSATISTSGAAGGQISVTIAVRRGNEPVATFSFLSK